MTTPRKPGRKFLPPALKRSRIIAVAYTEAEAERLERLAADHGNATAVYIRTAALARCDADEALRLPAPLAGVRIWPGTDVAVADSHTPLTAKT